MLILEYKKMLNLGNKKTDFWETKYAEFGKQKLLNLGNEKGWLWETKRLTLGNKIAEFRKQKVWLWETKRLTLGYKICWIWETIWTEFEKQYELNLRNKHAKATIKNISVSPYPTHNFGSD